MVSEAKKAAIKKYLQNNKLVEIKFRVNEEKRADIQNRISNLGYKSFNKFYLQAVEEKLIREENK